MNSSTYPRTGEYRSIRAGIMASLRGGPIRSAVAIDGVVALGEENAFQGLKDRLLQMGIKDIGFLDAMHQDPRVDVQVFGGMILKILKGEPITHEDRRKVRILLMRGVSNHTQDYVRTIPALQPIMDYVESQTFILLERGIIPSFHDLDKPDIKIPDFDGISGVVEHLHIPVKYGRLQGYIHQQGKYGHNSQYAYTNKWVLDEKGVPVFELEENPREGFYHTGSGYLGNGLFLVFQDAGNYDYSWRIRNLKGEVKETFKAPDVHNLGYGILLPSRNNQLETSLGLYSVDKNEWILKGEYQIKISTSRKDRVIIRSKESGKYGVYSLEKQSWILPCDNKSLSEISGSKEPTFLSQDEKGQMVIIDSEGKIESQPTVNTKKRVDQAAHYSDLEKFRYIVGFSDEGDKYYSDEFYILTSEGEVSAGPFCRIFRTKDGKFIFIKNIDSYEYVSIDPQTGVTREVKIPGKLILSEGSENKYFVIYEESGKYGIKDLDGNIVVSPQEHTIVSYLHTSGNLLVSKKVPTENHNITDERCPEEYQLVSRKGEVIIPWNGQLSRMEYVDDNAQFSCYAGKLLYIPQEGEQIVRDITSGWVQVKSTSEKGVYIIDEDRDRGGHSFSFYDANDNTVLSSGRRIPLAGRDTLYFAGKSNLTKLQNGNYIFGTGVVTPKGKVLIPQGSEKVVPYYDGAGKEIGVVCKYRNSMMKVTWDVDSTVTSSDTDMSA